MPGENHLDTFAWQGSSLAAEDPSKGDLGLTPEGSTSQLPETDGRQVTSPSDSLSSPWPESRLGRWVAVTVIWTALVVPSLLLADPAPLEIMVIVLSGFVGAAVAASLVTILSDGPTPDSSPLAQWAQLLLPAAVIAGLSMTALIAVVGVDLQPWYFTVLSSTLLVASIAVEQIANREARELGARSRLYLIGDEKERVLLTSESLASPGVSVVGSSTPRETSAATLEQLSSKLARAGATMVVVGGEPRSAQIDELLGKLTAAHRAGVRIRLIDGVFGEIFRKQYLPTAAWAFLAVDVPGLHGRRAYLRAKRGLEIACCLVILFLALPILALAAAAIRVTSPGGAIYRSTRIGLDGRPFQMLKLRTMTESKLSDGQRWADADAYRITTTGRFLRRFRLDELPQLVNVLLGEMSLIGPRPEQPELSSALEDAIPLYPLRCSVRPGITGWAQVCSGYCSGVDGGREKLAYDLFYIRHQSLRMDLSILARTVKEMVRGRGI